MSAQTSEPMRKSWEPPLLCLAAGLVIFAFFVIRDGVRTRNSMADVRTNSEAALKHCGRGNVHTVSNNGFSCYVSSESATRSRR